MSGFDLNRALFLDGVFIPGPGSDGTLAAAPSRRAVNFNGSDTVLYRVLALNGVSDSPTGTLSVFLRFQIDGGFELLSLDDIVDDLPDVNSPGVNWEPAPAGGAQVVQERSVSNYFGANAAAVVAIPVWRHVAISWDTNHAAGARMVQVAQDGVLLSTTFSPDAGVGFSVPATLPGVVIGSGGFQSGVPLVLLPADMAELYINMAEFIDLSVGANVEKFRDPITGAPVSLGADGSTPTGTAPAIYLSIAATGDAAATFAQNRGTGGNFTVFGSLTLATTDPF